MDISQARFHNKNVTRFTDRKENRCELDIKKMRRYPTTGEFPFWIQRNVHDQQDIPDLHGHEFVELIYVEQGVAIHQFQDVSYEIQAGDVFIINPGEIHGYTVEPERTLNIINCLFFPELIHDSLLRELNISHTMDFYYVQPFLNKESRFHHRVNLRGKAADKVLDILNGMLEEIDSQSPGYQAYVRMQMIQLLLLLSRYYEEWKAGAGVPVDSSERLVRRICGYIERNYNQKISLASVSELFHLGIRQLNRQFNKYLDRSVIEYVQQIRIEKAKIMLAETDEIIAVVASAVGYEDPAYFSTLFTREVGSSPGKYREQIRNQRKLT